MAGDFLFESPLVIEYWKYATFLRQEVFLRSSRPPAGEAGSSDGLGLEERRSERQVRMCRSGLTRPELTVEGEHIEAGS